MNRRGPAVKKIEEMGFLSGGQANSPPLPTIHAEHAERDIIMDNKIMIDWFSFTTSICSPEDIIELLGMTDCPFTEIYGFYGWQNRLFFGGVSVMYGGHDGLVMLEMSGQGCRTFETLGNGNFKNIFQFCVYNVGDCNITRLDVAYDDFKGYLNLDEIVKDTVKGNFVARTRKWEVIQSSDGRCVVHGTRKGSVLIRIYDKAAERNRSDEIPHWVRCELQLRQERAAEFVRLIVMEDEIVDKLYFAVLNHYLRYVQPSCSDSNKWRFDIAEHWFDFYNSAETAPRSIYVAPGMEYNASKLRHTYGHNFGGGIYTYIKIFGINTLLEDVEKAKPRLNPKYKMLLAEDEELRRVNYCEHIESI